MKIIIFFHINKYFLHENKYFFHENNSQKAVIYMTKDENYATY